MADYLNPLNKKVDANQVLIRAYDEEKNMLRVDAEVTATIGAVSVIIDAASGDNIKISDGVDTLSINPDGSINVDVQNITIDKDNDSIEVFQATHDNLNLNANVQQNNQDVSVTNPLFTQTTNGALEATQVANNTQLQNINTELDTQTAVLNSIDGKLTSPITVAATNLDIRDLVFATDKVDVSGSTVTTTPTGIQDVNIVSSIELEVTNDLNSPIPALVKNTAIDVDYDDIEITAKNDDGNPTIITIRKNLAVVRTLTLQYDSDGDFQRLLKA